jgi:hypothetical protein
MLHPLICDFRRKLQLLARNGAVSATGTIAGRVVKGNSRTILARISSLRVRNGGARERKVGAIPHADCEIHTVMGS